jgi:plasmid stabilization system protein ParE
MGKLVVSSAAERDYADALKWYAERSLQAAEHFEAELNRAIRSISARRNGFRNVTIDIVIS